MSRRSRFNPRVPALLTCAVLIACTGTETDNPVAGSKDGPPSPYESPIQFNPDESRGAPPCIPPDDVGMPRRLPLWGREGNTVIGAERYGGLRVLDASDALHPRVLSQLALAGEPRTLLVAPGPSVTLAVDELPELQQASVPEPRELEAVTRLVRYDLSDPTTPARLGDVAIEGELWRVVQRGELTWVMSAKLAATELSCDRTPFDCGEPQRVGLILTGYRFGDGSWSTVQRVELPLVLGPAWATPEGFASFESTGDAATSFAGGIVHTVRFGADDRLGDDVPVRVADNAAQGSPVSLAKDRLRMLLRDADNRSTKLAIFDLANGEQLSVVDGLPQAGHDTVFGDDAAYVGDAASTQGALLIDTRDSSAPFVLSLPPPISLLRPLPGDATRLVGSGQGPDGAVKLFLLQMQNGVPTVIDQVDMPDAVAPIDPEQLWLGEVGPPLVLFGYSTEQGARLGGYALGADRLTWLELGVASYADELVELDSVVYAPDSYGLAVASLESDGPAGTRLDWNEEVSAYVAAGKYEAALVRHLSGPLTLELTRDDTVQRFDVSAGARGLVSDGEHLLVWSPEAREQCTQTGLDCSDYVPNVAIFALGDAPAQLAELPLPDSELRVDDPDGHVQLDWEGERGPLAFGPGRFVLVAELDASCNQPDACDALGIESVPIAEANVNQTSQGLPVACPPGAEQCEPSAPPRQPTVYGAKRAQRLTVLDLTGRKPRFGTTVESVLELDDSRFASPRVDGEVLLATRLERASRRPTPGVPSAPVASARFMLDRFELGDDGELHALPTLNVPGFPLGLRAGGALLITAEPDADQPDAAILHRLALRADGAHVLQSLALPARFGAVEVVADRVIYLQRDGQGCDGTTTLRAIALPDDEDGELEAQSQLELPGVEWAIADHDGDRVLLGSGGQRYALVELGDDQARIASFTCTARYLEAPWLVGDAVLGSGGLWGKQRLEL